MSDEEQQGEQGEHPKPEAPVPPWSTSAGATSAPAPESKAPTPDSDPVKAPEVVATPVDPDAVTVTVPKAFNLRIAQDTVLSFKAGVQQMKREYADHWYSKAWGVQIYNPNEGL
jgi:hypothetical protein